eukprot:6335120-Amphidinium_carterae.1
MAAMRWGNSSGIHAPNTHATPNENGVKRPISRGRTGLKPKRLSAGMTKASVDQLPSKRCDSSSKRACEH